MKQKEYRYQFLGYDEIETGKVSKIKPLGIGGLYNSSIADLSFPIKKTIAMVFDKEKGIVKQVEIEKLKQLKESRK